MKLEMIQHENYEWSDVMRKARVYLQNETLGSIEANTAEMGWIIKERIIMFIIIIP